MTALLDLRRTHWPETHTVRAHLPLEDRILVSRGPGWIRHCPCCHRRYVLPPGVEPGCYHCDSRVPEPARKPRGPYRARRDRKVKRVRDDPVKRRARRLKRWRKKYGLASCGFCGAEMPGNMKFCSRACSCRAIAASRRK